MTPLDQVRAAYRELLHDDRHLLIADASERSLTHKLAEHLQRTFSDWDVDAEYNRDGLAIKSLDDREVFPDVIIHHRGTDDNFVVIEAKKSSTTGIGNDIEKLRRFKAELKYLVAIAVTFPVGRDAGGADALLDVHEVVE